VLIAAGGTTVVSSVSVPRRGGVGMLGLFRALVERVKAVLAVRAAQEIEADALAHAAQRRAELLGLAARYEAEGQHEVAAEVRAAVGRVDADRPVAVVLPAVSHLAGEGEEKPRPALPARGRGKR
jgi:hypothetical protein